MQDHEQAQDPQAGEETDPDTLHGKPQGVVPGGNPRGCTQKQFSTPGNQENQGQEDKNGQIEQLVEGQKVHPPEAQRTPEGKQEMESQEYSGHQRCALKEGHE